MSVASGVPLQFAVSDREPATISWSVLVPADGQTDAATIDTSGLFRATGAGRFLVVATNGGEHAFAHVTVTEGGRSTVAASPVTLSFADPRSSPLDRRLSLSLSEFWIASDPDTVRLSPGGTRKLTVFGYSADGARWTIRPEWKATGGSVSDSGLYSAPASEGVYRVVVTRQGDIQTDTSVVLVGAASSDSGAALQGSDSGTGTTSIPGTPVPSMPSITTACANEPSGYRRVIDAPWNQLPTLNPLINSEGFTYFNGQIPTLSLVQDPTAPASGPSILQVLYPKGFIGGFGPSKFATGNLRPNTGNLYMCFWFRFSPNWTTMGHTITKFFYVKQEGSGLAHAVISSGYDDHVYLQTLLQYPDNRLNYNLGENISTENEITGGWHRIEVLWEANTPGERNGRFHQWVDGRLTGSNETAYWFLSGLQPYWDSLWFEPTFGSPDNVVPADQSWYLDQMVVSVK